MKGFFGTAIMLLTLSLGIIIMESENQSSIETNVSEKVLLSIQHANLKRTEAEILADKAIGHELQKLNSGSNPELAKNAINTKLLHSLSQSGTELKICTKTPASIREIESASLNSLNENSKLIFKKIEGITEIEFIIANEKNYFFCAKIQSGKYSNYFQMPLNYSQKIMVMG